MNIKNSEKQNLTISLDRQTIQKAKVVAARRSTSISGLIARQIEIIVGEEEAYERAEKTRLKCCSKRAFTWVVRFERPEMSCMSDKTFMIQTF